MEKFVPVEGYDNRYLIGNKGTVLRLRPKENRYVEMKTHIDHRGYVRVELSKDGVGKDWLVHRLVAIAFIPNPEGKTTVNHKDENKQNNDVGNLEWLTNAENHNYGTRNKRVSEALKKPILRISKETGEVLQRYPSLKDAVADGYSHSPVSIVANGGRLKSSGGYIWRWEQEGKAYAKNL